MREARDPLRLEERGDVDELLQAVRATVWARACDDLRLLFLVGDTAGVFGYPADRLVAEAGFWDSIVHPADRAAALAQLRTAASTGQPATFQYRVLQGAGREVWLRATVTARAPDGTRLFGTTALAGDVPPGRLREDDAYRRIVEACPKAIAIHRDGELLFVNDAAGELVGAPDAERLVGRNIRDFLVPPERDEIVARTALVQQGRREVHRTDEHFRREDGTIIDVEVTSVPYRYHGEAAVLTVFSDVTARRRGEEARELLAAAFRASRDPIVLFRFADEVVVDVNPAWERATGVPHDEAVGRNERSLGIWASAERRDEFVRRVAESGVVRDFELAFRRRGSDEIHPAIISAERVELSGVAHVIVTGRDLTEQRRLEQQQRESQKTAALGRIAAGIAHDFNNVLTVIRSYTQLLEQGLPDAPDLRSDVREIARAADRGALLARQLLLFTRRMPPQRTRLDLAELVDDMARMLARVLPHAIAVHFERPAAPQWVDADPGQMEQVVMNLAMNARDAMPDGGTLTLTTTLREVTSALARERALALPPGAYVVLSVADTGAGMDDAVRRHLFEPFFTTKPAGEGTGLGLSTVQAIVRQHGGEVTVESAAGRGTRVEVYLPRA